MVETGKSWKVWIGGKLAESDLLNNDRNLQECDARGDAMKQLSPENNGFNL